MKNIKIMLLLLLLIPTNILAYSTSAESSILMEQGSKRIIHAKNIHKVRSVASISKIMTAIVAIEAGNLNDIVVIDEEVLKAHGSAIYIKIDEEMKLVDLLYGLMLRSGNDAALSIARHISGTVEEFVTLMNKKAVELGMKNSRFSNPSGLDDDGGNYSTAYDMALLTNYAMNNMEYQKIVKTKKHIVKTNSNVYDWSNKNKLLTSYKYATGGKTGYTMIAKRTLVTTASKNNVNLIAVTLNDGDDFNDHIKLYNEAFDEFKNYRILKKGNINIIDESYYSKTLYIKNNFNYSLTDQEKDGIYLKFELEKKRQYKENDIVGKIKVMIGDEIIYEDDVFVKNKVVEKNKLIRWFRKNDK